MVWLLLAVSLHCIGAAAAQPPEQGDSPSAAALFDSGSQSFQRKEFAAAASSFGRLCREYPASELCSRAKFNLAASYFLTSHYEDAAEVLESLPAPERSANEALHMLAMSRIYLGHADAARKALAQLHGLPAETDEARLLTARMMIRAEREGDAMAILKALLAKPSPPPGTHYYYGVLLMASGQLDEAIQALSREIAVNPSNADIYYKLGDAFSRKQDWNSAIRYLQLSIWLNPDQSGPYILLGKAYMETGNLVNAEGILRRASTIDPNNSGALFALAQVLTRQGRATEARSIFEKLRKSPAAAGQ